MQLRNRIRVLIVDDCAATRITLRAILNNNQYEVIGELNDGKNLIPPLQNYTRRSSVWIIYCLTKMASLC